jgi:hypothetical protein
MSAFRFLRPLRSWPLIAVSLLLAGTLRSQTAAKPAAAEMSSANPPQEINGYLKVGFERLAGFPFNPAPYDPAKPNTPPPSAADQIPERVKQLDGKKAVITGYMLPVKTDKGLVTEFLLMKDPMMCCYGIVPQINEWIVVHMTNNGVQALQDVPLSFYGKLHVKEQFDNGYLSGIYLLEAEKMGEPK